MPESTAPEGARQPRPHRALVVAVQDYANVLTDIAAAVNAHSERWRMRVVCPAPHPFGYRRTHHLDFDSATEAEKREFRAWLADCDVVLWAEESLGAQDYFSFYYADGTFRDAVLFGQLASLGPASKPWAIVHAGCGFRAQPRWYNDHDRAHFKMRLLAPDLHRLGSGDPRWDLTLLGKPFEVDLERAGALWSTERRRALPAVVFCHAPTNLFLKGTVQIRQAVALAQEKLGGGARLEYREIGGPVDSPENVPADELSRIRAPCHVYIDQFQSAVGGVGMSSLEAMADGMVTLCTVQNLPEDAWFEQDIGAGLVPLVALPDSRYPDSVGRLATLLEELARMDYVRLRALGMRSAEWMKQHFDAPTFARRWESHVLDALRARR